MKKYRITHCYTCKNPLDDEYYAKCAKCGWIKCSNCDACGCKYSKPPQPSSGVNVAFSSFFSAGEVKREQKHHEDAEHRMPGLNPKYHKLIAEMEELIMTAVPQLIDVMTVLEKKETWDLQEMQDYEGKLQALRERYSQIAKELLELDSKKASWEIRGMIRKRKQLEISYTQCLRDARDNMAWNYKGPPV